MVLAGHTLQGRSCDCPSEGCICEPGEQRLRLTVSETDEEGSLAHDTPSSETGSDLGPGMLLVTLGLLLWIRMRP